MTKVFFDSDVLLDVLLRRIPWVEHSAKALSLIRNNRLSGYTSPVVLANIFYIMRRQKSKHQAMEAVLLLDQLLSLASFPDHLPDIMHAHQNTPKDFEDTLQYLYAQHTSCDVILTRNTKDFPQLGKVLVTTPERFLEKLINE